MQWIYLVADMVAYLTEKKLWDQKLWLEPDNVKEVWDDYDFYVESRFLDKNVQSKIRWYSKQEISTASYLVHPMIFIDVEEIKISELGGGPLASVAAYACSKGGAFQGFDRHIDSKKIRDGDVYVVFFLQILFAPRLFLGVAPGVNVFVHGIAFYISFSLTVLCFPALSWFRARKSKQT